MKVKDAAERAGVTSHAVRYYTRIGLLGPERHPGNGYRIYPPRAVHRLRFIRQAQRLGYTLGEIRSIFEDARRSRPPCPNVRRILRARIVDNRQELQALVALQARMEQALQCWETFPDGVPDGDSVCHLIESLTPPVQHSKKEAGEGP